MHLGLIGYGAIATSLIEMLDKSHVTDVSVLTRRDRSDAFTASGIPIRFMTNLNRFLATAPALTLECAGHAAVAAHVPPLLAAGCDVIIASVGALADETQYRQINAAAEQGKARVILPSGAIGGLDMLRAISLAGEVDVTYRGIKPPSAWAGSAAEDLTDLSTLVTATTFFQGTGREAALAFPKNANVVAALALAGAGFDRMQVALVADPKAQANQHTYDVISPLCRYSMSITATPSSGNARTSQTTVLSLLHEITAYRASA